MPILSTYLRREGPHHRPAQPLEPPKARVPHLRHRLERRRQDGEPKLVVKLVEIDGLQGFLFLDDPGDQLYWFRPRATARFIGPKEELPVLQPHRRRARPTVRLPPGRRWR